ITAFRAHFSTEYALIDVSRSLIGQAADLAEIHGLRAYDAVQLAAALQLQNERNAAKMSGLIFVSANRTLNAAAMAENLIVEDPNTH
ncbi:MAG: type II toxin-antitoxin system VapC family toxin, partial [Blastocatellia bacterium]